jgi:DNA-binding transcriptional regulator YdaS (Cro superfamily)
MSKEATPFEALKAAVLRAGSQSALARICGVSQTAVWKWLQSGKRLPAEHVLAVEAATKVARHLLRPDIYPLTLDAERSMPGEDCASIVVAPSIAVACDPQPKTQRKDMH